MANTALAGALCAITIAASAAAQTQTVSFDIPAEPLGNSLRDFARESGQQIIFTDDLVAGKTAPALHGSYAPEVALSVLLNGSGLVMEHSPSGSIMVRPKNAEAASNNGAAGSAINLETVVVTGSLIPGAVPASPVITITAADISKSGYATVGDLIKALPQSFAGGQNTGGRTSTLSANRSNYGYATTADLRGLGSDATLTLFDGHRVSYGGVNNAVDLGLVPTAAIDKVEILTDGASALYGSDAVAGVVNIKLRDDFDGAEASVRVGATSDGGGEQIQENLLGGYAWDTGHLVAGFENFTQRAIRTDQRSYSSDAISPSDLIPHQARNSYFAAGSQELTPDVKFFGQGFYSSQGTNDVYSVTGGSIFADSRSSQYSGLVGVDASLPWDWTGELSFLAAGNEINFVSPQYCGPVTPGSTPCFTTHYMIGNLLYDVSANASGPLFELPTGQVKVAIGADYRHEKISVTEGDYTAGNRDVKDVYGEIQIPLVNPDDTRVGLQKLDLSASARYEDYSDFGSSTTPKVGLIYQPISDIRVRATWGKSFRAPELNQLYGSVLVEALDSSYATSFGAPPGDVIFSLGANPNLKPETSDNWTAGFDYSPSYFDGLRINATAFGIAYTNRIVAPLISQTNAYSNPVYKSLIVNNPSAALIQSIIAKSTTLYNFTSHDPIEPGSFVAYFDGLNQNATSQNANGFDLSVSYELATTLGNFSISSSSSWLRLNQRLTSLSPQTTLSGTLYEPAAFRTRDGVSWSNDSGFTAVAFLNFTSPETDDYNSKGDVSPLPNYHVHSWTTVDLQVGYAINDTGALSGLKASLSVTNLFNADPPLTSKFEGYPPGLGFDTTNANPFGRLISATVTKDW